MNFFGKKASHFDEEPGFYDSEVESADSTEALADESVPPINHAAKTASAVGIEGSSIELKVVRPDKYEDVVGIAEHLLSHRTVVLNLETANKEVCRRMIDFLSGVAYSIRGQIRRVTTSTYIITPNNVDVSDSEAVGTDPDEMI